MLLAIPSTSDNAIVADEAQKVTNFINELPRNIRDRALSNVLGRVADMQSTEYSESVREMSRKLQVLFITDPAVAA